jgi:hypothetical protein
MNNKYIDVLEGVSTFIVPLIPLIVGICFLLSLLFNLGFYLGLNLNLGNLPISFIDITNSTIKVSITAILALIIGYFLIEEALRKVLMQTPALILLIQIKHPSQIPFL